MFLMGTAAGFLSATSFTIGTANAVNSIPFSEPAGDGITTYQQVYASSAFSGPISIGAIDFFLDPSAGVHNQLFSDTLTITLSTTSIPVDGLYYHAPQGSDVQTFGVFTIGGTSPSVLTFKGAPFDYDPADGNLLVQFTMPSTFSSISLFTDAYFESDNSGVSTSRYCDESECNENQGLVTRFDTVDIPEPTSLACFVLGMSAVGLAVVRVRIA